MDSAGLLNYYEASYPTSWYPPSDGAATPEIDRQPNLQWTLPKTPTSYADGAGRQNNSAARNSSFGDYDASALDKDQSDDSGPNQGNSAGGPKRKRPSRYKNVSEDVLNKRRAQNRSSQRAYRDRKNMRIKELEAQLADVHRENDMLNLQLRVERAGVQQGQGPAAAGQQRQGPTSSPLASSVAAAAAAAAAVGGQLNWSALHLGLDSPDMAFTPEQMLEPWPMGMALPNFL